MLDLALPSPDAPGIHPSDAILVAEARAPAPPVASAAPSAPLDAPLIRDTHIAALAAVRAAADHAAGLASTESLICASDRAFHAARRAVRAAAATGCPEMAEAAARARCAYRVGQPV